MADAIWQDLRYATRSLARRPLVTSVTVLSLALGIGVNSAIFSVFDHLILRRLPVPAADALVVITSPGRRPGGASTSGAGGSDAVFSYPLFRDLERLSGTGLSSIAAHRDFGANLSYQGATLNGKGLLVSGGYFPALGITPAVGRLLGAADDRIPNAQPVAVLSHSYWSSRFGANPRVLGETLFINGQPMTIVGVAPRGFTGITTLESPQVFVPLTMTDRLSAGPGRENRRDHWLYLVARLEPGVTREQAQNRLNVPFRALIRDVEYPVLQSEIASDRERAAFQSREIVLQPGSRGRSAQRSTMRMMALLLFGVTGFVLLIACANIANLLLARATDRAAELALRMSLGASSVRLVGLLLSEATLLGVLGGVVAIVISRATLAGLPALMPSEDRAILSITVDGRVVIFTLALGLVTGVVFGLFPALFAARSGLAAGAHTDTQRTSSSRTAVRTRSALATLQIALATALLTLAGLFIVSLTNLARTDLGIRTEGLATFRVSPFLNGYNENQSRALFEQIEDGLRGIPGVSSVGESNIVLLGGDGWQQRVKVEGFDAGPDTDTTVSAALVSPDYFTAIAVPLRLGREFTRADAGGPKVAVVNEAFVRKFNLGSRAVGARLGFGRGAATPIDIEIVGVIRDAAHVSVHEGTPPQVFRPLAQGPPRFFGSLTYYVRSSGDASQLLSSIAAVVARADRNLPVENLRTMDEQVWNDVTADRVLATLSSAFAGLATLLAGVGLYAMLAHIVARRLREMGIRIALGARGVDVQRLVFAQVSRITLVGGAIGLALAFALGRLARGILFGLDGYEPAIAGAAVVMVVAVAYVAGFVPARRAGLVNPVDALRSE
jgi:predicted permease